MIACEKNLYFNTLDVQDLRKTQIILDEISDYFYLDLGTLKIIVKDALKPGNCVVYRYV